MSGYEVWERRRGNGRKLECCRGEIVDRRRKGRRGESEPSEHRTDFFFFNFFFQERQVKAAMQGSHWSEYGGKERVCVLLHVSV